jgi:LemA protein
MIALIVVAVLTVIVVMYAGSIYNGLVVVKNNVAKAWSNIDVLLKQRHDEIPKLVDLCSGYMKFEKETLEAVMKARSSAFSAKGVEEVSRSEGALSSALGRLFAVSENYPELKANNNFMHLQSRISQIESQIADRREFFNDTVNIYNIRIQQMPDAFVANFLNYQTETMFNVRKEDLEDVKINFNFPGNSQQAAGK